MSPQSPVPPELERYTSAFAQEVPLSTPPDDIRFVALDCETTGTDARRDRIITMGAVTVTRGEILLEDQFESLVRVSHNTSAVLVHGVTAEEAAREGVDEQEAILQFLDFVRDGVIVGHHIGFDIEVIRNACRRCFQIELKNRWIDTMELTLHLEETGVFEKLQSSSGSMSPFRDFSLDGLCRVFQIQPHDRHTAAGDAFITAQIFLKLLRLAKRAGRDSLETLIERYVDPRASD